MIIYYIKNKLNGKGYVGQTTKTLNRRWSGHLSNAKNKKYSSVLAKAILKYGLNAFELEVLEKCDSLEALNEAEVKWISIKNTLVPYGYNVETGGKNNTWTEEMKEKMSKIQSNRSEEWQKNLKEGMKKRGQEWRKKISESRKNITPTEKQLEALKEGRRKGRKGLKGEKNPRSKVNEDIVREIRKLYATGEYSQSKLAKEFGVNQSMVSKIILRQSWGHIE